MGGDLYRKSQQVKRESNRNTKREDSKQNTSEENAIVWYMMALEHKTKAVADLCAVDANERWGVKVPNMVFDGTKG